LKSSQKPDIWGIDEFCSSRPGMWISSRILRFHEQTGRFICPIIYYLLG
jgi:hypothetical protein